MSWQRFLVYAVLCGFVAMAWALIYAVVRTDIEHDEGPPEPPCGDVPAVPKEWRQ